MHPITAFAFPRLITFGLAVIVLAISPGPDLLLIIGRGVGQDRQAALYTALGMLIAGLIQVPLLALGLGLVIASFSTAFNLVRILGAVYLGWRGLVLIRRSRPMGSLLVSGKIGVFAALRDGLVASLCNPKGLIFMLAFLPQFVDQSRGPADRQMLILGVAMKLIAFAVESAVAMAAGALGRQLSAVPRLMIWQKRLTGCVMLALGVRLLFAGDNRLRAAR